MIKRILAIAAILLLIVVVTAQALSLRKLEPRTITYTLSDGLKERIVKECVTSNVESIVDYSCDLTCELLTFKQKNNISKGEANCVGYAQLTAAICNYAFTINNVENAKASPVVGKVYLAKSDLNYMACQIFPKKWKSFIKDHDFVEITIGDDSYYVDSCLKDLLGSDCRTAK